MKHNYYGLSHSQRIGKMAHEIRDIDARYQAESAEGQEWLSRDDLSAARGTWNSLCISFAGWVAAALLLWAAMMVTP